MPATAEQIEAVEDIGAADMLRLLVESDGVGGVLCDLAQICDELAEQDAIAKRYTQRNQWYKCARMIEEASGEEIIILGWRGTEAAIHRPGTYRPLIESA